MRSVAQEQGLHGIENEVSEDEHNEIRLSFGWAHSEIVTYVPHGSRQTHIHYTVFV